MNIQKIIKSIAIENNEPIDSIKINEDVSTHGYVYFTIYYIHYSATLKKSGNGIKKHSTRRDFYSD